MKTREQELEELLRAITPALRDVLWCALVWNDHNFDETDLRDKATRAAESLGYKGGALGHGVKEVNAWMGRINKVLYAQPSSTGDGVAGE